MQASFLFLFSSFLLSSPLFPSLTMSSLLFLFSLLPSLSFFPSYSLSFFFFFFLSPPCVSPGLPRSRCPDGIKGASVLLGALPVGKNMGRDLKERLEEAMQV